MPEEQPVNNLLLALLKQFLLDGLLTKEQLYQAVKDHKITLEEYQKAIA